MYKNIIIVLMLILGLNGCGSDEESEPSIIANIENSNNDDGLNLSDYGNILVYKNLDAISAESFEKLYENEEGFAIEDIAIECSSIEGFKQLSEQTDQGGMVTTFYINDDSRKSCTEFDTENVIIGSSKGTNNLTIYFDPL